MGHGVKSEVRGENMLILLLKQKEIPIADYNFYHYPGNPLAHNSENRSILSGKLPIHLWWLTLALPELHSKTFKLKLDFKIIRFKPVLPKIISKWIFAYETGFGRSHNVPLWLLVSAKCLEKQAKDPCYFFQFKSKKTIQFSTNTVNSRLADTPITWTAAKYQGPVPERPISFNPVLKFCSVLYLHSYALLRVTFCVISTVSRSKDSTTLWNPELHVLRWENRAWNLA